VSQCISCYFVQQGGSRDRSICREMKCWVPSHNDCFAGLEQRAFEGTTCGNQMLCLLGNCVTNEFASTTPGKLSDIVDNKHCRYLGLVSVYMTSLERQNKTT